MRRKISLLLALCLCVGALSGCMSARERFFGKPSEAVKKPTEQTEPTTEPTTEPSTEPSTQENRTDVLTCEDVMSFVEAYVEENFGMTISATDFEVKDGEHAGDLFYSFTYEELFLHVMVTERDGNVIQIVGTVLPFKLAEIISPEDAIPTALAFAAVPVLVCEEDSDLEQIVQCFVDTAAPMEESETTMEGAWSGDGWEYSGMMNGTTVIIGAQRQGVDDNQQTEPVPPTTGTEPLQAPAPPWVEPYKELIQNDGELNFYSLYDMNGDGTPELFLRTGQAEADMVIEVWSYLYYAGGVEPLGSVRASHTYAYPVTGGGFLLVSGHMGYETISTVDFAGGELFEKELFSGEVGEYHDLWALPIYTQDDMSELNRQGETLHAEELHNQEIIAQFPGAPAISDRGPEATKLAMNVTGEGWNGWTVGLLSDYIFERCFTECEPYAGTDTQYLVTLSGYLHDIEEDGSVTFLVDVETGGVSVYEDSGVLDACTGFLAAGA